MRIDRLLAITTYLLNRNIVTGKKLAEKFEVSERTIQRDIETINMAGIPIVSLKGVSGGYQIMDTFKVMKQPMTNDDIEAIIIALKGLETTLENEQITKTLEKIKSLSSDNNEIISIDFSIINENQCISKYMKVLSDAIVNKKMVTVKYCNADQLITKRNIEPVMLKYMWYTWYVAAYCLDKQDYRIFKLNRIQEILQSNIDFEKQHIAEDEIFDKLLRKDNRKYIHMELSCTKKAMYVLKEYIPKCNIAELDEDTYICEMSLPENERMWYSIVLSLGTDIKVISPVELKERIVLHSKKILEFYNDDI
ncbi:helix-turn-helix transcriptional regulator [Vallitalea guaymasensis]|uniref:helix-turn-helix transcriptional regulator n=1 Tax=Vallitalea guaymasensis TaxID=1185412 RepID=UPI00272C7254|nr:YafY family protein [Vallitalea guaymasensis]